MLEELEEVLITSDIGFETSEKIIEAARKALKSEKDRTEENIIQVMKNELIKSLEENNTFIDEYSQFDMD